MKYFDAPKKRENWRGVVVIHKRPKRPPTAKPPKENAPQ